MGARYKIEAKIPGIGRDSEKPPDNRVVIYDDTLINKVEPTQIILKLLDAGAIHVDVSKVSDRKDY